MNISRGLNVIYLTESATTVSSSDEQEVTMVSLVIDGLVARVPDGTTILKAAQQLGIYIPTLCYHEDLRPYAGCRFCVVEITQVGSVRHMSSCDTPIEEGMVVRTNTERIKKGRKMLAELLLARCPDQKPALEIAARLGVKQTRFSSKGSDCVLCGLCVRLCEEVAGAGALGLFGRAPNKRVGTPFDQTPKECIGCGGCTYICSTGAMHLQERALEEFRKLSGPMRRCRYQRMGLVEWRVCPNSYQCHRCEYNLAMEDMCPTHPIFIARPAELKKVKTEGPFRVLPTVRYHPFHVWVKPLDELVRIGLDDFACQVLGAIQDVECATAGAMLEKDVSTFVVKGERMSARFFYPLSGTLGAVNKDILDHPKLVGLDPYGRGWIATIEPSNLASEIHDLPTGNRAVAWLHSEMQRLYNFIVTSGGTIQTGVEEFSPGTLNTLDAEARDRVVEQFFSRL
jgi:glycine cleavage system H lipoate-binding protein/ferredoxin